MRIDVVSDTVCPWCYVGKRRLERALDGLDGPTPEIVWHPFQLNPDMPAGGMDRATYLALKFGGEGRAAEVGRTITEAAATEGLTYDPGAIERTPNTLDSHRLIYYAGRNGDAGAQTRVVEALFHAYFEAGTDIGDTAALVEVAAACGFDAAAVRAWLDSDADAELVREQDRRARAMGIQGVPFFVFAGRHALPGAQDPQIFRQVLSAARENAAETSRRHDPR